MVDLFWDIGCSVILPGAVLFDLDGTLLDSEPLWLRAEISIMSHWSISWTTEDQSMCLGGPLERVADYMVAKIAAHHHHDLPTSHEVGELLLTEVALLFRSNPIAWRPGAQELVKSTHSLGVPTAIVTASWRLLLDVVMESMAVDVGNFDTSIAGDEVEFSKPHPFPYLEAAVMLNADITSCLAIEDSPTGVQAAVTAGAVTIAVEHVTPILNPKAIVIASLEGQTLQSLWRLTQIS
jgi:HAD superfamily hydrolase (TIGR01509 family)